MSKQFTLRTRPTTTGGTAELAKRGVDGERVNAEPVRVWAKPGNCP